MKRNYAAILFCAAASLGLGSAQSANQTKPAPAPCPPPKPPCPPAEPENISDGTKAALACEWIDPAAVVGTLKALRYYTTPIPTGKSGKYFDTVTAAKLALGELIAGATCNNDLYQAAQGQPDAHGQPDAQGIPAILDMLASANTINTKKPANEAALFKETDERFKQAEALIAEIFKLPTGKQALAKINASFGRKDNYVALFQLLDAYPTLGANASDDDKTKYVKNLEILRAAYSLKSDRLASLVAGKVSPAKQ